MQVSINGETREVPDSLTVGGLVELLELGGKRIAVERNGEVVPRSRHGAVTVTAGDQYEIIIAVGGG